MNTIERQMMADVTNALMICCQILSQKYLTEEENKRMLYVDKLIASSVKSSEIINNETTA